MRDLIIGWYAATNDIAFTSLLLSLFFYFKVHEFNFSYFRIHQIFRVFPFPEPFHFFFTIFKILKLHNLLMGRVRLRTTVFVWYGWGDKEYWWVSEDEACKSVAKFLFLKRTCISRNRCFLSWTHR